jgi:hypothetical protein
MLFSGYRVAHFKAPITACRNCPLGDRCLRHPERTRQRQVTIIKGREGLRRTSPRNAASERMRWKFDTPRGREIYSRRMATVEPVFANLQNKGMRRFTLRGQRKSTRSGSSSPLVRTINPPATTYDPAPSRRQAEAEPHDGSSWPPAESCVQSSDASLGIARNHFALALHPATTIRDARPARPPHWALEKRQMHAFKAARALLEAPHEHPKQAQRRQGRGNWRQDQGRRWQIDRQ